MCWCKIRPLVHSKILSQHHLSTLPEYLFYPPHPSKQKAWHHMPACRVVKLTTMKLSGWLFCSLCLPVGLSDPLLWSCPADCLIHEQSHAAWYGSGRWIVIHGHLTRYVKLRVAHAPGMPEKFSPFLWVSDPDMHHGTCVTHVFLWSQWRGKRPRHSRGMRNPQLYVSGKRPMD